jgi:hypothetical protein
MNSGDLVIISTPAFLKSVFGVKEMLYVEPGAMALLIRIRGGGSSDIFYKNDLYNILTSKLYTFEITR